MLPPLALGGCRSVRGLIQGSATCDEFTPSAETLTQMECIACRKDAPTVTDAEIAEFILKSLTGKSWSPMESSA